MKNYIIQILASLAISLTMAQEPIEIEKGFRLLEDGKFSESLVFFERYLETSPDNRAAQICYGRSLGLSGDTPSAVSYFKALDLSYPGDLEIDVNRAESLLWDNQFEEAKILYKMLLEANPNHFSLLLGNANCLSNLKEYQAALESVNKALVIEPANQGALISRKYIRLAWAHVLINRQEYASGKRLLQSNLIDFPLDKESLNNLANAYLASGDTGLARESFIKMADSTKDSITAMIGISLVSHIEKQDKDALKYAREARIITRRSEDPQLMRKAEERFVQALLWNKKYKNARTQLDSLDNTYGKESWILGLEASYGLYSGKSKSSLKTYEELLVRDSTSFDGNLGKANALFANDRMHEAYQATFTTLDIFENQKDALALLDKLNKAYTPAINQSAGYSSDSGQNSTWHGLTSIRLPLSTKISTQVSYAYRETNNQIDNSQAESHSASLGIGYKWMPKTRTTLRVGINKIISPERSYTQPTMDLRFNFSTSSRQKLELIYNRELENFNAALIQEEIVKDHLGLSFHQSTNLDLGLYTQFIQTAQSDENNRTLFFSSVFYQMIEKTQTKIGVNYQYISFREQRPEVYFSPEEFHVAEIFSSSNLTISPASSLSFSGATGFQIVETNTPIFTFRGDLSIQHRISNHFNLNIYGMYSNLASSTAAGFEYMEAGIRFQWIWSGKKLFADPRPI
ncbi:MAG: tetratricopeptide repeat protein [Flavobacteriaceae bacterium]|nr:tetratricopeptide repeat protein [Flavobacteriaceae bacterium]